VLVMLQSSQKDHRQGACTLPNHYARQSTKEKPGCRWADKDKGSATCQLLTSHAVAAVASGR
jgi:hypothetical protein